MIESIAFRTQARTVDHLGREQIADCPTAISELWKNAYDAYARSVSLHIFDDPEPVAAIFDDGHGMTYDEFIDRWLVVGTDSKFDAKRDNDQDRNGLPKRSKQGQKGIGRLSSANLGPLLLVVSKRAAEDFVAALIDWRIFENPYLILSDIELPVTRFSQKSELFELLPGLFDRLTDNVWGNTVDAKRTQRLETAWAAYDRLIQENGSPTTVKPSEQIVSTIVNARFEPHHIEPWSLWNGAVDHGTALLVSEINYDLRAQLNSIEPDGNVNAIRESFFSTLSAFTDPYVDPAANETNAVQPDFTYEVITWTNKVAKAVIEDDREAINRSVTDSMEHVLSGNIDQDGVFHGQVKAFGEWQKTGTEYVIYPPTDYNPPKGPTTFVGPVGLHVATFERERMSSTLSDEQYANFDRLAEQHSGFLIFRNGLRVLPYGRADNDFFEIEERRSRHAGREFWNKRRMFGRVTISRELNPNLRDKAGREGFIDNRSAKALKVLIINILKTTAREYFGHASELRKELLPDIQLRNQKQRAEDERKVLAQKNAKKFRANLEKNLPRLNQLFEEVKAFSSELQIVDEATIHAVEERINAANNALSDLRLTYVPARLGSSEDDYRQFRRLYAGAQEQLAIAAEKRTEAVERIKPKSPHEIAERQLQSLAGRLHARLNAWRKSIDRVQKNEHDRISNLFEIRSRAFHDIARPLVEEVRFGRQELNPVLDYMAQLQRKLDEENEGIFQSYIDMLELMSENINIELIARQGTLDNIELRDDLNKLNQVAQLGVTVEIMGHELSTSERMIREGLRQIKSAGEIAGTALVETGFEAISRQLEFLAPLKVSGSQTRRFITGKEIGEYLKDFFEIAFKSRHIDLKFTEEFASFGVDEQPSRLLPVFVNLVNNSIYWLVYSRTDNPQILLSVVGGRIVISDNGPGIDPVDQESLFKIFFTRKVSGGRGIGLYLCRVNLMAGGHTIEYATKRQDRPLGGANFVIDFKGASFG